MEALEQLQEIKKKLTQQQAEHRQALIPHQQELERLTATKNQLTIDEKKLAIKRLEVDFKNQLAPLVEEQDAQESILVMLPLRLKVEREKIKQEYEDAKKKYKVSGGARHHKRQAKRAQKKLKKALDYCGCRSNAYYQSLLKKVMRDRQRHQDLMKELHYHAIKLMGGGAPMTQMLNQMAHDEKIYGARRTQLDAKQWSDLAGKVKGGGCGYMLRAGGCCVTGCE